MLPIDDEVDATRNLAGHSVDHAHAVLDLHLVSRGCLALHLGSELLKGCETEEGPVGEMGRDGMVNRLDGTDRTECHHTGATQRKQ